MRAEHEYDVPPARLFAVLTDEGYLAERNARYGGGSGAPSVAASGGAVVVRVPRQLPVDAVPAAFRAFVGSGAVVQVETWTTVPAGTGGAAAGTWTTEVGTSPLELGGTQEITATPAGCRHIVTAEVKVRVPFVGKQAENMVRGQLQELVGKEQDFAAEWLARG